jgi:hypothetical protein
VGLRRARIVDLSATGERIDGLEAPAGSELHLMFTETSTGLRLRRRARVMRSATTESNQPWVGIAFIDEPAAARAA